MGYSPPESWKKLQPKDITPHPVTSVGQAVSLIVLHHSVTNQTPFFRTCQAIERFHHAGVYDDFAYNGAVSNVSDDYTDGRGPLVQGGATGNRVDTYSLSIVAVGSFHLPTDKRFHEVTDFLIDNVASLIVRWIKLGHVSTNFEIQPHRSYYETACCGNALAARIPDIMSRVKQILNGQKDDDMTPMSEWWKTYNRAEDFEYHPHIEFIQNGLKSLGFYRANVTGKKNLRTKNGWEAFERSVEGTDNNDRAGQKSWDLFLEAVFAPGAALPPGLADAVNAAHTEIVKAKTIVDAQS